MASSRTASSEIAPHEAPVAHEASRGEREYRALREGCALLDRSERGKLALSGPDAVEFLEGQITNELLGLNGGEGRYAAFLTHKGKMLGDLRVLVLADASDGPLDDARREPVQELLLDTERAALQPLFDMIRRYKLGYRVELHKRTLERGLLSLIGPRAGEVGGAELAAARLPEAEHSHATLTLAAISVRAIRTSVGVDLLCGAEDVAELAGILGERGALAVSEQSAEILRVERGEPRYGIDLDDTVIPQEAGLNERAVSFTKGCYVGQETVARLHYKGKPNRHLRGLRLSEPIGAGVELSLGERVVGTLTSSVVSPSLGPIGLALVRREAPPGSELVPGEGAKDGGSGASARVVELPFGWPDEAAASGSTDA
jgi:tRNA-modifying protein YgfZ